MERKSEEGNKTQNEKLQRDRRLWNGNTKSKQFIRKKVNNQTATKPLHHHNWDKTKTFRAVHPQKKWKFMAHLPIQKKQNPAHRDYKLVSLCSKSDVDSKAFFKSLHSMHHI